MEPLAVFLLYSLRFSVIFSVVILWVVAVSDIRSNAREGSFTTAKLMSMTVAVSVVAVGAIAALNAVVPTYAWIGIGSRESASVPPTRQECEAFSYTFTYSFGLRWPTSVPQDCMVGIAKSVQQSYVPLQRTSGTGR